MGSQCETNLMAKLPLPPGSEQPLLLQPEAHCVQSVWRVLLSDLNNLEVQGYTQCSGLSARFEPQRVGELARILVANTQRISRQMGFRPEPYP